MKMIRLSWGARIAMLYAGFVLLIVTMVTMSVRQDIDLVSEDYYAKELAFQGRIDATENALRLEQKVSFTMTEDSLLIQYPPFPADAKISGEVHFFRPSDDALDRRFVLAPAETSKQAFALSALSQGMYKLQISWMVDETPYYSEQLIVIP